MGGLVVIVGLSWESWDVTWLLSIVSHGLGLSLVWDFVRHHVTWVAFCRSVERHW
jgi:hypothetical protein